MIYSFFLFALISLLTYQVYQDSDFLNNIDNVTLEYFHTIQTKFLDTFFSYFTWLGSLWLIAPLFISLIFILIKNSYYLLSLYITIGFLGAISTTYGLKYLLLKKRPDMFASIDEMPQDPSFPSAHTTQAVIFSLLLILVIYYLELNSKYFVAIILIFSMILVAISRMYLQVHFLSDVLGGILIAMFWTIITYHLISYKAFT